MQQVWEDEILTKEIKQDVFDALMSDMAHGSEQWQSRYAAASPCKLPVIPDVVGDFITDWKSNHRGLFLAIISCNDVLSGFITPPITNCVAVWVAKYTDAFATAWLLGDWEVEQ